MDDVSQIDHNKDQFRDILSTALIEKIQKPKKSRLSKQRRRNKPAGSRTETASNPQPTPEADAAELSDFSDYIASMVFDSLSPELQTLTHQTWSSSPRLQESYRLPLTTSSTAEKISPTLDPAVSDSLTAYAILTPPSEDVTTFLTPILTACITSTTTPPPPPSSTRRVVTECEMCGRDWVPLTHHHLIPRMVHSKALRRGWVGREEDLHSVAWLCRACHSFVHGLAGHEELAREYFTVERLMGREEVSGFAAWVGKVRWKAR